MATPPKGKKPVLPKSTPNPATKPAARKKAAGKAAPASKSKPRATPKKTAKPVAKPKRVAPIKTDSTNPEPQLGLTPKQQRFVDEYLVDLNATQAAIRAGYSANSAQQMATENLSKPVISAAITAARKVQQERTGITADRVLREIAAVALADARELVEVKTGCCRCCYGEGFKWQRTVGEMNHDRELWLNKGNSPADFDEKGGIGFNPLLAPNVECPSCGGDGYSRAVIKDTRHLSPNAAALYAGAKQTKEGIEVKMHSKMDAIEKLARHLGLYEKDNQQKTDPLASLLHALANGTGNGFKPVALDPEMPAAPGANSLQPRQESDNGDED